MGPFQVVTEKVAEVARLAVGFVVRASENLVSTAQSLSSAEMITRLDLAIAALRGEEVSTSGAAAVRKVSPQIAHEVVESYSFDEKTGVSTFTMPAGVTDVEAMKVLNKYFRKNQPSFKRDAVYAGELEWYERLPKEYPTYCQERDYSQARQITITGVVKGTEAENRTIQAGVFNENSLVFSDPRDQALAAAIHACKHRGEHLFKDLWARGSVPGFVLRTTQHYGVCVNKSLGNRDQFFVAASGSLSLE